MANNRNTWILALAVIGLLAVVAMQFERIRNHREIDRVTRAATRLQREKDSIEAVVQENQRDVERLADERAGWEEELLTIRRQFNMLEQARWDSTLSVRQLKKTSDLQARLEQTFPELAATNWGLTSIPFDPEDTLGIEYFLIPAWFTETFIIDHQNAESWLAQRDKLLAVDSLNDLVVMLQDSVVMLHARNALALQSGYDNASTECQDLSNRYIAELRRPTLSVGSTVGVCLVSAGVGFAVGAVINR